MYVPCWSIIKKPGVRSFPLLVFGKKNGNSQVLCYRYAWENALCWNRLLNVIVPKLRKTLFHHPHLLTCWTFLCPSSAFLFLNSELFPSVLFWLLTLITIIPHCEIITDIHSIVLLQSWLCMDTCAQTYEQTHKCTSQDLTSYYHLIKDLQTLIPIQEV